MDRSAGSQLLSMMALVAAVVAIVILFFFGVGYLFGTALPLSEGSWAADPNRVRGRGGEVDCPLPFRREFPMALAIFGIKSTGLDLAATLFLLMLVVSGWR